MARAKLGLSRRTEKSGWAVAAASVLALIIPALARAEERPADFVNLLELEPSIEVRMMYQTSDNFIGRPARGYHANICYLSRAAAEALQKAQKRLRHEGARRGRKLTLAARDCYRPQKATLDFLGWMKVTEDQKRKMIHYPRVEKRDLVRLQYLSSASGHSRGSSIDLTIVEEFEGGARELDMGTIVDFFGEESKTRYERLSTEQKKARGLLLGVMAPEFKNYSKEWWHFTLRNEPYPSKLFDFDIE